MFLSSAPKSIAPEALVSIIMPAYNSEKFIRDAINSVIEQTYQNWELIIVDDCSTDKTSEIIRSYKAIEPRIICSKLNVNSGAAIARNNAVDMAKGSYIAFLDSDDLWEPEKLYKQIGFMNQYGFDFTCTGFYKVDEQGCHLNQKVRAKPKSDYWDILKNCPGNSTVIYDARAIGKIKAEDIRKRNDYVMWLKVIRKTKYLYGLDEFLGSHRIRKGSISWNKVGLVKYQWKVYREIEQLTFSESVYILLYKIITTILKR